MKIKSKLLFLSALLATTMTACDNAKPASSKLPPVDNTHVDVFVLSGQSNMEGSTYYVHPNGTKLLENYFEQEGMDYTPISEGIKTVKTSYYGFYYPNGWAQAHSASTDQSSAEAKMNPNFQPTTVGMGVGDQVQGKKDIFFGPELGIANTIAEHASEENPVHLVKCAFSGSGFTKTDGPNWNSRDEDPTKSLFYLLKTYTKNCLDAIKETGKVPVLKGFIWHQGESDGGEAKYEEYMRKLLGDFREEFKSYAVDEDPDKIAFLDCTIYDGTKLDYGDAANKAKFAIADESEDDLNFCVNALHENNTLNKPKGLALEIGGRGQNADAQGGYNIYHYNTADAYKLGKAYGEIILENNLLRAK